MAEVHGVFDLAIKNDYVTPRGLLVSNTGVTIQPLLGISIDVCDDVAVTMGVWNDIWTDQGAPYVGAWNELDWYVGVAATPGNWLLSVQYLQFVSPPHYFHPENNIEFILGYNDSESGLPITFNPYLKVFWTVSGDSTVVVGRQGNTYDVEIGLIPTYDLTCFSINAPTWITVGPPSFWNGGPLALKNKHSCFGVFSTGLHLKFPYDNWYFTLGGQYYCLINTNLLQAQTITLGISSYTHGHRNIGVATARLGLTF